MLKYLRKYWIFAVLAPLFMMGEVAMDLIQPRLMSTIVDEGVLGLSNQNIGDLSIVLHVGAQMIGTVLLGGFFGVMAGVFANLCAQQFGNDVRKDCFRSIMSFSFEQTDQFSTGSLVTRVTNDVTQVQNLVMQSLRGFIRTGMFLVGGLYCMATLHLQFGVITACAIPLVILCILFFMFRANPMFGKLQKKLDRVNHVMQENVSASRVVKAYVREEYEEKRFGSANQDLVETQLHVLVLFSFMMPLMNIVLNLAAVFIIYIGSIEVKAGALTPGNVMAAITYLSQILNGVMMLVMIFQTISRGAASAKRLREVLNCVPAIADGISQSTGSGRQAGTGQTAGSNPTMAHSGTTGSGRIEFRHVSFAYPGGSGEDVLHDLNFTIEPGETIGILGATGSGKSSLVNLIPRFYDVTQGQVLLDGVDVREYALADLRNKISIAMQKSELFSRSIAENIAWGSTEASQEDIQQAAQTAQASEFIERTEEQYDTLVAEKGMSLSGGQKQRIAISRAILKKAEVFIFDDSTSALDLKTEAALYQGLKEKYRDVTKIMIAQRIASVRNADRILVLDNGRIAAFDHHEQLMQSCSIYQDIYASQLGGGVANGRA